MYKYLLLFTIDFNSNNEKIYIFVVKKKKKNKNRNLQFKNELSKEVKIAVYSLIKKKRSREKRKQFPILSKRPILHPRNFQKIPKRGKHTHAREHLLNRDATIIDQNDWQSPPSGGRRAIGQEEKDRGARLSGAMGKKSDSGKGEKGNTVAD